MNVAVLEVVVHAVQLLKDLVLMGQIILRPAQKGVQHAMVPTQVNVQHVLIHSFLILQLRAVLLVIPHALPVVKVIRPNVRNVSKDLLQQDQLLLLTAFYALLKIVFHVLRVQLALDVKLVIHQPTMDKHAHNVYSHAQFAPKLISQCVLDVSLESLCLELIVYHVTSAAKTVKELLLHVSIVLQDIILEQQLGFASLIAFYPV